MSEKRINLLVDVVRLLIIVLISGVLVSAVIFMVSEDPSVAIYSLFLGPFESIRRIGNIIEAASPLIFTALAVIIIFNTGQFSMISEGSFFIGAMGATIIGITCKLPSGIHPVVALLFAGVCGGIVAMVPAFLKKQWGVDELVTSIMFNYVVQFFALYLINYHFREIGSSTLVSLEVGETAALPTVVEGTRIHVGVLLGLALCVLVWMLMNRTPFGKKATICGDNPLFAKYTGLKVTGIMFAAQIIAGAIAGIGGGAELLGMYTRFKWNASPGYGWTGIVVALLARKNPLMVPFAALFIGYLNVGADIMARSSDVGREFVGVIQGIMMFLVAAEALLKGWRQHLIVKQAKEDEKAHGEGAAA